MIKVKFEWTRAERHEYDSIIGDYKVVSKLENIPDQEFNNEKEMLDFALNKYQTIIVRSWKTDEKAYGLTATEEEKKYDYEIELYNDYRE